MDSRSWSSSMAVLKEQVVISQGEPQEAGYWRGRAEGMRADPGTPIHSVDEDRYEFKDYAEAIAGCVLNTPADASITIGIDGAWGTGKTSLTNLVDEQLQKTFAGYGLRVDTFDAWTRDQDARGSDEFYRWVTGRVYEARPGLRQMIAPTPAEVLPLAARRSRRRSQLAVFGGGAGLLLGYLLLTQDKLPLWVTMAGLTLVACMLGLALGNISHVTFTLGAASVRIATEAGLHGLGRWNSARAIRSKERLVEHALELAEDVLGTTDQRCVFIIDNLDRCRPKSATEIIEAIDQLTQRAPVVVIIAADMNILARQIADEYHSRHGLKMAADHAFGKSFLERIVTVPFTMPSRPLDNPFERSHLGNAVNRDSRPARLQPRGEFWNDFRLLRSHAVPAFPRRVGDLLRRDHTPWPAFESHPAGRWSSFKSSAAEVLHLIVGLPTHLAVRLATAIYPAPQRPIAIDGKELHRRWRWLSWTLIGLIQLSTALFSLSLALLFPWFVIGSLYLGAQALSGMAERFTKLHELPTAPSWFSPFQDNVVTLQMAELWRLEWFVFVPSAILLIVGTAYWARQARRTDRWTIHMAITEPREGGYPNPRIDAELQHDLRRRLGAARDGFDGMKPKTFEAFGIDFLPTHRNRKRMANRARLLGKIAEKRSALRAIDPMVLVAWSIALESDTKPGAQLWDELVAIVPALQGERPNLICLGVTTTTPIIGERAGPVTLS
jgi:Cdc6-like AAA superfamily ATPase